MRRPERRNRKSGTSDFGWKKQNEMSVPELLQDRFGEFSLNVERVDPDDVRKVTIQGHEISILSEPTRADAAYPCSVNDVIHLLSMVPDRDLEDLDVITFRQPTRKQSMLDQVWGRLYYYADFRVVSGSAIILEALEMPQSLKRSKKQSIEERSEIDRLRADGHRFDETSRDFIIHVTKETARNTVLYRTVLHELGHWVDFMRKVVWTETMIGDDYDSSHELYFARPTREREDFAHRYADEMGAKLREQGLIPFDPR